MSRFVTLVITAASALAFATVADPTQVLEAGSTTGGRIGGNWCC
jgi:hypothetical protein